MVIGQDSLPAVLNTGDTVQKVRVVLVESLANGKIGINIDQVPTRLIVDVSSSTVNPTRSSLLVEPVEPPWSGVPVAVSASIDIDINDCTEEVLKETLSTVVETRGTIGEVRIVKIVESLANLDGGIDVDLIVSSFYLWILSYSPSLHRYDPSSSLVGHLPNKGFGRRSSW